MRGAKGNGDGIRARYGSLSKDCRASMYTAEIFVDSTGDSLGAFRFGSEPRLDRRVVVDGKEYIIVGKTELSHPNAEYDYEVRVMPDDYFFDERSSVG